MVDDVVRLYATIAHEVCHVTARVEKGVCRPAHGSAFMGWAQRVDKFYGGLVVSTYQEFESACPVMYMCT